MGRLINADALKEWFPDNGEGSWTYNVTVKACIDAQPTIDAVPKEKILLFLNIANEELSKAHANKSANGIMTWSASVTTLEGLLKEYDTADTDTDEERRMSDLKRRNEADELREQLSNCHDYIAKLEAECKDLKERLHESDLAIEHNRHLADEGQLKGELRYRDGIIYGLKYAIRCNGVSGGEINQ